MKKYKLFYLPWMKNYYDGEGGDDQGGDDQGGDDQGGDDNKKSFTQDELNGILAKERRKYEEKINKQVQDLEKLQQNSNLTQQEKSDLEKRISELKGEVESKEKLAAKDLEKTKRQYEKQLSDSQATAKTWENRFKKSTLINAITKAAIEHKAFDPGQIIAQINTFEPEVVEDLDDSGNPKGTFTPKVKYNDTDKDGNPVVLSLTVTEAVKRMKENTNAYGNLFQDTTKGGLGLDSGNSGKDIKDVNFKGMDLETYKAKFRDKVAR